MLDFGIVLDVVGYCWVRPNKGTRQRNLDQASCWQWRALNWKALSPSILPEHFC